MLRGAIDKFHMLKYGLGVVLVFVGLKMVVAQPPVRRPLPDRDLAGRHRRRDRPLHRALAAVPPAPRRTRRRRAALPAPARARAVLDHADRTRPRTRHGEERTLKEITPQRPGLLAVVPGRGAQGRDGGLRPGQGLHGHPALRLRAVGEHAGRRWTRASRRSATSTPTSRSSSPGACWRRRRSTWRASRPRWPGSPSAAARSWRSRWPSGPPPRS